MEFVIKYMWLMIGITAIALIYAKIHKTAGQKTKNFNFQKVSNQKYSIKNENKPLYKIIGFIGATFLTIFILSKLWIYNPIIGKWQSETTMPFIGKSVNEIEFTKDKAYNMGTVSKVNYEIDGNKIIITDGMGIGIVYEMIDKNTMKNNILGIQTIYKRIK